MEYLNIAVVSPDEVYNRVLCVSLLNACRQLEVFSYTTRQFVLAWADYKGRGAFYDRFDLILWAGDEVCDSYGDNIIYLTDRASLVKIDYANLKFALYRYSPTSTMVAQIFDIYSHLTGRSAPIVKRDNVSLIAFASFCGGAGCTTAARAVCQELVRFRGKRVLYISLEDVASTGEFMTVPQGTKTEGEYLYRLLGRKVTPFLEPYLIRDGFGVCSFAPSRGRNPLRELSGEEMQIMLAAVMDSGLFDVIIADVSTCLDEAAAALMESAERICLIAKTAEAGCREDHYMKQLKYSCGNGISSRIIRTDRRFGDEKQELGPAAPLEGAFGSYVSKLTETLMNVVQ